MTLMSFAPITRYMTVQQAADMPSVQPVTIYQVCPEPIPSHQVTPRGRRLFDPDEVHEWVRFRCTSPAPGQVACWCCGYADTVDHVQALVDGGARLDPANLVACRRSCNPARPTSQRAAAVATRAWPGRRRARDARRFWSDEPTLDPAAVRNLSPGPGQGRSCVTMGG